MLMSVITETTAISYAILYTDAAHQARWSAVESVMPR